MSQILAANTNNAQSNSIKNFTVSELWEEFILDLQERTSYSNWRPINSRGNNWILPAVGSYTIENLSDQHLQKIINAAFCAGRSRKYLHNIRADLISFFKFCRKCKMSSYHPEDIVIPKSAPVGQRTILQPCDLITLFTSSTTVFHEKEVEDELIYAYRFQIITGLRPGELLGLRWTDIAGSRVILQRSININGEITSGKNDNARRLFYLNASATAILNEQKQCCLPGPYVFPRVTEKYYRQRLTRYCRFHQMPVITPYEARHTFVSVLQCLPEGELRAVIGHSKNMDTFGVYAHSLNRQRESTAQKIMQIFHDVTDGVV